MFLKDHRNVTADNGIVVTKCKLIKHLTKYNMVPIQISNMYKLCQTAQAARIPIDVTWTEIL